MWIWGLEQTSFQIQLWVSKLVFTKRSENITIVILGARIWGKTWVEILTVGSIIKKFCCCFSVMATPWSFYVDYSQLHYILRHFIENWMPNVNTFSYSHIISNVFLKAPASQIIHTHESHRVSFLAVRQQRFNRASQPCEVLLYLVSHL